MINIGDKFNPFGLFVGAFIPNCVYCHNISDSAKLLLGRLYQYAGRDGKAFPTRKALSKEMCWQLGKLDRYIKELKEEQLISTYQANNHSPSTYTFLYHSMYMTPEQIEEWGGEPTTKSNSTPPTKPDKHKKISKEEDHSLKPSFKKEGSSAKNGNVGKVRKKIVRPEKESLPILKKKTLPILKKKTLLKKSIATPSKPLKEEKSLPAPKYKWNATDHKYLLWIYSEFNRAEKLVTVHSETSKVYINLLDKIHALFSHNCKAPYHAADNSNSEYTYKEWTIDELFDTFHYHIHNTKAGARGRIKNFGKFIFSEGFNGGKSWSPLIYWFTKMNRTDDSLNAVGNKLYKSMKANAINDFENLESMIYNSVAQELERLKELSCLFNGDDISDTYPLGLVSCFVSYTKHQTNQTTFKLVYIRGKQYMSKFIEQALKTNTIKKKNNGLKFGKVA